MTADQDLTRDIVHAVNDLMAEHDDEALVLSKAIAVCAGALHELAGAAYADRVMSNTRAALIAGGRA